MLSNNTAGNMNSRMLFTKYYFGNAIFWSLCATIGFVSYAFMSFSFQFLYELFDKNASYHLFGAGAAFLIIGTVFLVFRKLKPNIGFRSLIWTVFFTLILMYWGGFIANAFPKVALYIFAPVYFFISLLLLLFIVSWKRSGGVPMIVSFILGIFLSGVFSCFYGIDFSSLAISVRITASLFLLFTIIYLCGCFGIFKKRLYYVGLLSLILFSAVMYPFDTDSTVEEFKRFKWEGNKTVVGKDFEYIGSYKTVSRNIDVFMHNSSDNKEEMKFVENGSLSPYSYPIQDFYKYSFYVLLMQNKVSKNILAVGDIPSGLVDVLDNFSALEKIDYMPVDPMYPEFWANFIHDDMFQKINIVSSYHDLKGRYDLVLLYPPYIKGVGAAPYVNKAQFQKLKDVMSEKGTFVVITSGRAVVTNEISGDNLKKLFKNVKVIKLSSGLSYIEGSNDADNISIDPTTLKYRLLQAGIQNDYAEIKSALDGGSFFIKSTGIIENYNTNEKTTFRNLYISTLLVLSIFVALYCWKKSTRRAISYLGSVIVFSTLGAVFGDYALSHQRMFVDLNVFFPLLLSVFLFACGLGLLFGIWWKKRYEPKVLFVVGLLLFLVPSIYKYFGGNDAILMSLILGTSSLLIFGTKLWELSSVSISNMVLLLGTILVGLGTGFVVIALFDYNMLGALSTDRYFMFVTICLLVVLALQIKFTGEME